MSSLVEVEIARNMFEAHLMRSTLEAAGIPAFLMNEELQAAIGDVPLGFQTLPRICVEERHVDAARKILDDIKKQRGDPDGSSAGG